MATRKSAKAQWAYFMCVPQLDDTGDHYLPMWSEKVYYRNDAEAVINNIHRPAVCKGATPINGVYSCDLSSEDGELAAEHLTIRAQDDTKPVIGPFDNLEAGRIAVERLRRPTRDEEIARLRAREAARHAE